MTPEEFHTRVVSLAKERKISIRRLETLAGFPEGTIKQWKSSFPAVDRGAMIARCLGVSMDYLFLQTDDMLAYKTTMLSKATHKLISFSESANISEKVADIMVKIGKDIYKDF